MKNTTERVTRRLASLIAVAITTSWAQAADRTISANYTLTGDETVDGVLTVESGVTVDLNGFRLTVQGLAGDGTITCDPDFVLPDLTSASGAVTWSTKAGNATGATGGNGANLFNDAVPTVNAGNDGRILVKKGSLPLAVTYDFGDGTPTAVNKYKIYFTRTSYLPRGPKVWMFEGSNDNRTWTSLDSRDGVIWTAWDATTNPCKEFSFNNDTAYRYYRITITDSNDTSTSNGGPYLELNQLEYFDTSAQPELRISVPDGAAVTNATVAIAGSVKVVKAGEGEFAEAKAGQTYTGGTILTEGTYALAGTATLNWPQFTFGTNPAKPVTLAFGAGAVLSPIPDPWYFGNEANVTSTVYKTGGDWSLGELTIGGRASGAVSAFYHTAGSLTITNSFTIGYSAGSQGTLEIDGGTVTVAKAIVFNYNSADSVGIVNLRSGGVLSAERLYRNQDGSATLNFDGGTLVITSNIEANKLFSKQAGGGAVTVTVSENGGTIDNGGNANSPAIGNTITGEGGLTLTGNGTTRIFANQSYLGTTTVSSSTTLSVNGVSFAGPVAFESGSTLNIASYTAGVVPLSPSELTLPAEGAVGLAYNGGAFPVGVYAICSVAGVTAADGAKFEPATGGETASWKVVGNTLLLAVGTPFGNNWTGLTGDGKMSTPGNWADCTAPIDGEDVDFSGVSVSTTINADIANAMFGTVTMGAGPVVFTNNNMKAKSFSDTSKVAVAANSTVTLDGDLVFGTNVESYVCRYIFEGGTFVVTGDIIATPAQTGALYPHVANNEPGSISAKGLVNNAASDIFCLVQTSNDRRANWLIGEDGISGSKRYTLGHPGGGTVTIKATADFFVSADIIQYHNLTLIPDGHEITLGTDVALHAGGILGGGYNGANGLTTVTGPGKVVANYNVANLTSYAGSQINAFKVADGGTLDLVPGANLSISTNSTITVTSGATLKVAESGTATLNCNLALADGACLGFNFTDRNEAPVLALAADRQLFFAGDGETTQINVKVSSSGSLWPRSGVKTLSASLSVPTQENPYIGRFDVHDVEVSLDNPPKWAVADARTVNDDGQISIEVKPMHLSVIVK